MSPPDNKRSAKAVFNLTGFRARLISIIVIGGFACVAVVTVMFYAYVLESFEFVLKYSKLPDDIVADRFSQLWGFAIAMGGIVLIIVLVVAVWTLYITHRVSGPTYHLHRVIEEIRAGKSDQRVQLRRSDELQELARSFNALMDETQGKTPPA
jgi:HAMP domain-containing protein